MTCLITIIYLFLTSLYFVTTTNNVFGLEKHLNSSSSDLNIIQRWPSKSIVIRPPLYHQVTYLYAINIAIGTSKARKPLQQYYVHVDTGSPLSWIQCEGCKKCFKQIGKPYPNKDSLSFRPVSPSDKLCSLAKPITTTTSGDGKHCSYNIRYNATSYSSGIVARETLYLCTTSIMKKCEKFENLVIGCGLDQGKIIFASLPQSNDMAGVLGLGRGPLSFLTQIDSISHGKFSYCLPPRKHSFNFEKCKTQLRFGADAVSPKQKQLKNMIMSTKLIEVVGSPFYYVELQGISFDKKRLQIDPRVFRVAAGNNGQGGGVIVNSGVRFSRLVKPAYDVLMKELDSHFSKLKYEKVECSDRPERLRPRPGYTKINGDENHGKLPTITFHFVKSGSSSAAAADLVVKGDAWLYPSTVGGLCLGMLSDDKMTVIGAYQQIDHWVMFDTKSNQLFFHQEDCTKNIVV